MAQTDDDWQYAHLAATETGREMAPGANETNRKTQKLKKKKPNNNKKTAAF